jgi:hypothetical protein
MGTRSLVNIYEGDKTDNLPLVTIYRQYDGYPTGRGNDLYKALNNGNVRLTNGVSNSDKDRMPKSFNGMGELAAWYVGNEKSTQGIDGNVYIYKPGSTDCGEEYIYNVYMKEVKGESFRDPIGTLMLEVIGVYADKVLFDGPMSEFNAKEAEKKENEDEGAI